MILLSDAIRLGSLVLKPEGGQLISRDGERGCALGMAGVATGESVRTMLTPWGKIFGSEYGGDENFSGIRERWPWITQKIEAYPCGCPKEDLTAFGYEDDVEDVITHIFDDHVSEWDGGWTLQMLIDWVRAKEVALGYFDEIHAEILAEK